MNNVHTEWKKNTKNKTKTEAKANRITLTETHQGRRQDRCGNTTTTTIIIIISATAITTRMQTPFPSPQRQPNQSTRRHGFPHLHLWPLADFSRANFVALPVRFYLLPSVLRASLKGGGMKGRRRGVREDAMSGMGDRKEAKVGKRGEKQGEGDKKKRWIWGKRKQTWGKLRKDKMEIGEEEKGVERQAWGGEKEADLWMRGKESQD